MSYSIKQFINVADKKGRRKVYIRVVSNRKSYKIPTNAYANEKGKLTPDNKLIADKKELEISILIMDALRNGKEIGRNLFADAEKGGDALFVDYVESLMKHELKGVLSNSRINHYRVLNEKVRRFAPDTMLRDISVTFLNRFTSYLSRSLDSVTVHSNMSIMLAIIKRAIVAKLIPFDAIMGYKRPKMEKKYPIYLTDKEIEAFERKTFAYEDCNRKTSGYYFLLACYAGYRISDLYQFNESFIEGELIRLRAEKNGKFVTMPIHDRLIPILEYVKTHPITKIPQQHMREYVRFIAEDAGIRKHIKVHSGRHTFASFLVTRGLSLHQLAHYLGDGKDAAAIYAHLVPNSMDEKIKEIFKKE